MVGRENIGDPPLRTPVLQAGDEGIEVVLVAPQKRGADGDLGDVFVLDVDEAEVADELGFHRAAARCHVSQPTLSAQVQQLESVLGVMLFERDRRHVIVTTAGAELVASAGSTMGEIVASVRRVNEILEEISHASREQSAGIEQVNRAVGEMDQVTQQNAALVEQAAATAQRLAEQADVLDEAVRLFTVAEATPARRKTPEFGHRFPTRAAR